MFEEIVGTAERSMFRKFGINLISLVIHLKKKQQKSLYNSELCKISQKWRYYEFPGKDAVQAFGTFQILSSLGNKHKTGSQDLRRNVLRTAYWANVLSTTCQKQDKTNR